MMFKEEKDIPIKIGWGHYNQIRDLFKSDKKKGGFSKKLLEIEELLVGGK